MEYIKLAIEHLNQGKLVVFPTDTLYALGADPRNNDAITKIFELKGRSFNQPLPVLLGSIEDLVHWVDPNILLDPRIKDRLYAIVNRFWPGPLTIVVKKSNKVSNLLTANQDSIALRIPDHPIALALLKYFNYGIIGTSANLSGSANLMDPLKIANTFGKEVLVVPGEINLKVGSTIVAVGNTIKILREGAITLDQLSEFL